MISVYWYLGVDKSLNSELHLRTSPFLQSKSAVRQAATFETLAVVKRLSDEFQSTGVTASPEQIKTEVARAVKLLSDSRKYPKHKILSEIEEEIAEEAHEVPQQKDSETLFEEDME